MCLYLSARGLGSSGLFSKIFKRCTATFSMAGVPTLTSSFLGPASLKRTLQLFCVDLSGTIHIGDDLIPGTIEALAALAEEKFKVKFVTNTTKESKTRLIHRLTKIGLNVNSADIYSSLSVTREYIVKKDLRPIYLVDDNAMEEFDGINSADPNCVVVGLAPEKFNYTMLNSAFRTIHDKADAQIVAIHKGRFYKENANSPELSLGPGPFVSALEYATGKQAVVLGKPNVTFFESVMKDCGCRPKTTIMIGDDVRDDIIGAISAGMNACLVKTGKYKPGDENLLFIPPGEQNPVPIHERALVVDSFAEAVRLLT